MKPIKVLHVCSVEKSNYYLNNLTDFTDASEVEFSFATFYPPCEFGAELEERGRRVFYLDCVRRREYAKAFRRLKEIYNSENPDIVHTHLFDPTVIGFAAAKGRGRIFTRHHSDALYAIPSPLKRAFYLKLEAGNNRRADHIIAPSRMVKDILIKREKVSPKKISLIPYGQTGERFDKINRGKIESLQTDLNMKKNLALVCTARLFHRKGHEYLFRAFADLTAKGLDATLYLIGSGDYEDSLKRLTRDLKIEKRVEFLGWRDDALAIIGAADIVVHPSLEDALSSAVIESLMMKKPIVATDISGVRDILHDGKYGKIVPPADAESFRNALADTIKNLAAEREKASRGRDYLLEYMNPATVAKAYMEVYKNLSEQR